MYFAPHKRWLHRTPDTIHMLFIALPIGEEQCNENITMGFDNGEGPSPLLNPIVLF